MKIYLASRYSRREELCGYRQRLEALGHKVTSRWLNGSHQIDDKGTPIGDQGTAILEGELLPHGIGAIAVAAVVACEDVEDVRSADLLIAFTEPPRSGASRGGRHVEFGLALGLGTPILIVGHRENIFCWLPDVSFYPDFESALATFTPEEVAEAA